MTGVETDEELLSRSAGEQEAFLAQVRERVEALRAGGELTVRRVLTTMKELKAGKTIAGCKPTTDTFTCEWTKKGEQVHVTVSRQLSIKTKRNPPLIYLSVRLSYPREHGGGLPTGSTFEAEHPKFERFVEEVADTFEGSGAPELMDRPAPAVEILRRVADPDVDIPA